MQTRPHRIVQVAHWTSDVAAGLIVGVLRSVRCGVFQAMAVAMTIGVRRLKLTFRSPNGSYLDPAVADRHDVADAFSE